MSRDFKNILKLYDKSYGKTRRENLTKEVLKDSSPLPQPLVYKDIDEEFKRWVDEDLAISYDGQRLQTLAFFSNQRFTEYRQSWNNVDDKKNIILNFKTLIRENNPQAGTIVGETRNIPGDISFLMQRVEAQDNSGHRYFIDYRVKQPLSIDLRYTVGIVCSKYELLNEFNMMVNEKFKSIDCYIRPKGHFIPMKLENISDESEYSLDNRQYYSQTYEILVMGYVIPPEFLIVEETPSLSCMAFEDDNSKHSYAEIEELPCNYEPENEFDFTPINLYLVFDDICTNKIKPFQIDCNFKAKNIVYENARRCKIYVNDTRVPLDDTFEVKENDWIKADGLNRKNVSQKSVIKIEGYDPTSSYKKKNGTNITEIEINDSEYENKDD